jgi:hypothetical protein
MIPGPWPSSRKTPDHFPSRCTFSPNLRVPDGDREDSLGLSEAMPQVTDQPQQGALKGRESLTTTEFPTEGQAILRLSCSTRCLIDGTGLQPF